MLCNQHPRMRCNGLGLLGLPSPWLRLGKLKVKDGHTESFKCSWEEITLKSVTRSCDEENWGVRTGLLRKPWRMINKDKSQKGNGKVQKITLPILKNHSMSLLKYRMIKPNRRKVMCFTSLPTPKRVRSTAHSKLYNNLLRIRTTLQDRRRSSPWHW